jgi:ABC-type nitrate/sulfonate/bicarbonate transport system permease component
MAEPTAPLTESKPGRPESEAATMRKRLVPSSGAGSSLSDRGVRALVAGLAIAVVLALLLGIWLGRIS